MLQIPVLKSRASTRQFKLLKDDEGSSSHDLQQWLKRKPSVWQSDNLIPLNIDKVNFIITKIQNCSVSFLKLYCVYVGTECSIYLAT